MNDNLSELLPSIPENIQVGLAIFITEISSIIATAKKDTMLHPWGIFRQSDDLVQWLKHLTPDVIQPIVGVPFTGPGLVYVLSNAFLYVNRGKAIPQQPSYHVANSLDISPSDVPILVKYLIMRLSIFHQDLIGLILNLPPLSKAGFAAILDLAPPDISQGIVDLIIEIDHNIFVEDSTDPEPVELDLYSFLVDTEVLGFLLGLPENLLAPYQATQHGGYALVQKIASSQIVVDFLGQNTPTGYTIAKSGKFRLDSGLPLRLGVSPHYSMEEVTRFVDSLPKVHLKDLTGRDKECSVCTTVYIEGRTRNDTLKRPVQLRCGHIFCRQCLRTLLLSEEDGGQEHDLCPICRAKIIVIKFSDDHGKRDRWIGTELGAKSPDVSSNKG